MFLEPKVEGCTIPSGNLCILSVMTLVVHFPLTLTPFVAKQVSFVFELTERRVNIYVLSFLPIDAFLPD